MNKQLLASTAVCLVLGTAAFAQSPNSSTNSSTAAQPQTSNSSSGSPSTTTQPSTSTPSTATSTQHTPSSGTAAQAEPSNSTANQPASNSTANPSGPAASQSPSQAQSNPPAAQPSGSSTPAQAQTSSSPAANSQAQQTPSGNAGANTAQQPAQSNTSTAQQPARSNQTDRAQSSSTNVNASVNINDQQRTRLSQSFARLNVKPLNNVNFSVSVGAAVPRDVHLQTLPSDIVEIVPQYRGYSYVAVRDEIVIVDPATSKIVMVLPHSGGSTAAAPASSRSKVTFSDRDRDVVRRHSRASTERRTTGSSASSRVEIRRGERVPDTVEIEEFPETVYREAPALREYRYIQRDNRTYVVEPSERRVIEEID